MYVHRYTQVFLTTAKHTAVFPSGPGNFQFFFSVASPNRHVDPEAGETKPSRGSVELCVGNPKYTTVSLVLPGRTNLQNSMEGSAHEVLPGLWQVDGMVPLTGLDVHLDINETNINNQQ